MSLKSIELQLAIPKSQELGKLQNQMHQNPVNEQSLLVGEMRRREVEKRKRTEKMQKAEMEERNTSKLSKPPRTKDAIKGQFVDIEL